MSELFTTVVVLVAAALLGARALQALPRQERTLPTLSLLAHLAAGPTLLAVMDFVFGTSDVNYYFDEGKVLSRLMDSDPWRWVPEVFKFVVRIPNDLSTYFPEEFAGGDPTSSMVGAAGLLLFFLNNSRYAAFVLMAALAFFGKLAAYQGMRTAMPAVDPRRVAVAMMLIPSVVFWSSGVVKESFATIGLGMLTLWVARLQRGSLLRGPQWLIVGAGLVALFKPYLLFPFTLAAGAFHGIARARRSNAAIRPLYVLVAGAAVIAAITGLSLLFPEFAPSRIGEMAALQQQYGAQTEGGSNYALGNEQATTLTGQLAFAPIALLTVLVRPFIFEVRNFTMLMAAGESTAMLVLLVLLFRRVSVRAVIALVLRSPALSFCTSFSIVAGLAIGLATSNFGTLSRYRIPMMPYYVLLVLILSHRESREAVARAVGVDKPGAAKGASTQGSKR
jgi:hypothetical protein